MDKVSDQELEDMLYMTKDFPVSLALAELRSYREAAKRQQPFPGFNLGPTGETSYQTYHRGFKDGWNAGKVTI
jgi:hypothetical protein